jgi:hypothetical protein
VLLPLRALDAELKARYGIGLEDIIEVIFWDGEPGALAVFKRGFPNIPVVYCLQHAKGNVGERCDGHWKPHVRMMVDMVAFNPPAVAHHSIELLLDKLLENDQSECAR